VTDEPRFLTLVSAHHQRLEANVLLAHLRPNGAREFVSLDGMFENPSWTTDYSEF